MEAKKLELIHQIGEVFMRYGIKSVTMDDIAKQLKVSKKTLYKYFSDKSEIVTAVMSGHCELDMCTLNDVCETADNAIDELLEFSIHVSEQLKQIHPSIHYDLEKYYPEAFEAFQQYKQNFVYGSIVNNLNRGIKEGLYRENLNPEIIARIYVMKMDMFFEPAFIKSAGQNSFVAVYLEYMRYHLNGVSNEKGRSYLKEALKKEDLKHLQ